MWTIFGGTIVNIATVAVGSTVGILFSGRIPQRYQRIVLDGLGLITIILGIDAGVVTLNRTVQKYGTGVPTYGARLALVVVGSVIIGAVFGTWLRLHERIEGMGKRIHDRLRRGSEAQPTAAGAIFAEGFLTASVIFCVGPLTLLGCLMNGAGGDPSLLYIKSCLDGFCSIALAASLGLGVAFSALTVLVFQGGLALAAHLLAGGLPDLSLQLMNAVGGVLLLATALSMLEIKRIPVANMLPALFLPPAAIWGVEQFWPALLLRAAT